jgi:hypothetical protein
VKAGKRAAKFEDGWKRRVPDTNGMLDRKEKKNKEKKEKEKYREIEKTKN